MTIDWSDKPYPRLDKPYEERNKTVAVKKKLKIESASEKKRKIRYQLFCKAIESEFPGVIREYRFHPTRRWRFDHAWPAHAIALEVDGGAWTGGRHTRGKGFIEDMQKRNAATFIGWRVFNVTHDDIKTGYAFELLTKIFKGKK